MPSHLDNGDTVIESAFQAPASVLPDQATSTLPAGPLKVAENAALPPTGSSMPHRWKSREPQTWTLPWKLERFSAAG